MIPAAFVVIVAAEALVYAFIRSKGVSTTGDEPHYLVVARALSHLTVHPLQAYETDLRTHQIYHWPAGTAPTNLNLELYTGPHGPVSTHNLGLSALLAPFVALGGTSLARLGLMAIETVGFIYFYLRGARLAGLSLGARVILAVVIGSPAIWLAGTQIYPDLLTGILIACALVDVVAVETRGRLDGLGLAVSAFSLALLPWLHQQNLVPALFILIAFALVARQTHRWRAVAVIAVVAAASWLLLLAYNLYDYGHPLGLPQPFPSLNKAGITDILGLLMDRHQGLFVQVPTAALGLIGLWLWRMKTPVAVIATVAAIGSLIYLNGTFIHAPYGGDTFAGRFAWSSLIPLLAWCPMQIASLSRSQARLWGLGAVAAVLWLLESVPILRGDHVFYNQLTAGIPWDPSTYPGWWDRIDRLLPVFIPGSRLLGSPWFGLPVELVLLGLAILAVSTVTRLGRTGIVRLGIGSVALAIATGALALVAPIPLPARPLAFSDADLGGPIRSGTSPAAGPTVRLQGVGAGTFEIVVDYTLQGPAGSGTIVSYCTRGSASTSAQPGTSTGPTILPGTHSTVITLHCPSGTIWFEMVVQPATTLAVGKAVLAKIANG